MIGEDHILPSEIINEEGNTFFDKDPFINDRSLLVNSQSNQMRSLID